MRIAIGGVVLIIAAACAPHSAGPSEAAVVTSQLSPVDWGAIGKVLGRAPTPQAGGVYRFSFPRSDLHVTVGDVVVRPALALGSWVAFKPVSGGVFAVGDLVLTNDEVAPVIAQLQTGGVEQMAIHHHLLGESPRLTYVHIHGVGDPLAIARAIHAALSRTATPPVPPDAGNGSVALDLDTAAIARALGRGGRVSGGVYQVGFPRAEVIRADGVELPPTLGLATSMNFQPTGNGRAAVTGDFVLLAAEVNPVIRELVSNGIAVTSLHNHMLTENPRLFFMHFWANGDVMDLARGLHAALEHTNTGR